jgi:hypothetical protein
MIVGVDLGLSGAIAALGFANGPQLFEMPVLKSAKGRSLFDVPGLKRLLVDLGPSLVVAERLQPLPNAMGGSQANFARGLALGTLQGLCVALNAPYELVAPQAWQRVMLSGTPAGDTKQRSILAASRLFPGVSLRRTERCKVDSDGFADALLLAEYARRSRSESNPPPT